MDKRRLSGPNQWLIKQCQRINFGRITFQIRGGEPDLDKPWRTSRTVKLASGENGPRPEIDLANFELRKEQIALIEQLSHLTDGACVSLEVKHGLPFLLQIEQDHLAA